MTVVPEAVVTETDFLDRTACGTLIRFYEENIQALGTVDESPIFSFRTISFESICYDMTESNRTAAKLLNRVRLKACNVLRNRFDLKEIYPEYTQIVGWHPGSSQGVHVDRIRPGTTYAAIVYLNDNFKGGETYFPGIPKVVRPKAGMMLGFCGRDIPHGVNTVWDGTRFTVPCWFTDRCEFAE